MHRPVLSFVLALLALGAAACDEPVYMNRPLSSWVYDLESDEAYKRRGACEALGEMGAAAAKVIPKAVELLDDKNDGVQEFCRVALGKMGAQAVPQLEALLARPEPHLRFHAAAALVNIDPKHVKGGETIAKVATGVGNAELAERAQKVIAKLGPDGVAILMPYLDDPYPPVRLQVVKTLGNMGKHSRVALPALEKLLSDQRPEVRVAAMQALAKVGTKEEVEPVLRGLLEDENEEVADNAGGLLQYIGARESTTGFEDEAAGGDEPASGQPENGAK